MLYNLTESLINMDFSTYNIYYSWWYTFGVRSPYLLLVWFPVKYSIKAPQKNHQKRRLILTSFSVIWSDLFSGDKIWPKWNRHSKHLPVHSAYFDHWHTHPNSDPPILYIPSRNKEDTTMRSAGMFIPLAFSILTKILSTASVTKKLLE